jgi:hypothetical protein
MSQPLLPPRFLFRFSLPCHPREPVWTDKPLDAKYRLPSFAEMDQQAAPVEVRAAWGTDGLAVAVIVEGKKQPPWCRAGRPEDSDGVQLWIDTRDVHNVHRASRFCHRFLFIPFGNGPRLDQPMAAWLPINRAREHPRTIPANSLQVRSQRHADGYLLEAWIPAESLTGFDPAEHPRLGFNYAVMDRELGEVTLGAGSPMPYQEDPSLWATLELMPK